METRHFLLQNATKTEYENAINEIALILKSGGLVAVPTETVYGLAASALCEDAVKNIFTVKGRPQDNPLIVHVASPCDMEKYAASVPPLAKKAIEAFMPGPFTAILPKKSVIPSVTTAGMDSVAIRCPSHKIMHDIIDRLGEPIAAPSANLSGKPSPTDFSHCVNDLEGRVEGIVDGGASEVGVESTVVSFLTEKAVICRPGAVTFEMLCDVLGKDNVTDVSDEKTDKPISPGMKYRHYSPSVPLYTVSGEGAADYIKQRAQNEKGIGFIGFSESKSEGARFFDFGSVKKPREQLARLFAILREADNEKESLSLLLCERPDKKGEGSAALNRLSRAASHKNIEIPVKMPKIIAITGKSGSGKSSVGSLAAKELDFGYIDCDRVANEVIWSFAPLTERIKEEFEVNGRSELSKKVFANKDLLLRLNFLSLPVVISEIDRLIFELVKSGKRGVIVDGATVIESGFSRRADKTVFIKADKDTAISRIMKRDGIEKDAALARINAQKLDGFYGEASDVTVENNGAVSDAVAALIAEIGL
ncbi:MAG: threonylcarbamoyl-AMP synthase [Clostridia bacterium]|nr:threonylcarbamoyl-AMP synthase [Clostridia bacterium]